MQTQFKYLLIVLFISSFAVKAQMPMSGNVISDSDGSLYWVGTIAFSAVNLTTTYFNVKKLHKYDKYRSNAIFGAISGCAQTALGFANLNASYENTYIPTGINIGLGLTTIVTSVVRLATKNPPKENKVSLNILYLPDTKNGTSIVGLCFNKQF